MLIIKENITVGEAFIKKYANTIAGKRANLVKNENRGCWSINSATEGLFS